MSITELSPKDIWKYFNQICQVPRPSGQEQKIQAYLKVFATEHKLEVEQDKVGNILIKKPASKGMEKAPIVILQSHIDMVCEKNSGTIHDFAKDPIQPYVDGEWVKARGTTLGADNGIGMAAQLAVLASTDIVHGPIEALFTVEEETGLSGAMELAPDWLKGKLLLNLDSEDEGEVFIGCSGGVGTIGRFYTPEEDVPQGFFFVKISISGLTGGHSGCDIHLQRANANKLLGRFLYEAGQQILLYFAEIDGGNLHNAIPREAHAIIGVPSDQKEHIRVLLNIYAAQAEECYKETDPHMRIVLESVPAPKSCIQIESARRLIASLVALPHGVIEMSQTMPDLVETSTNLASVKRISKTEIEVVTSQRSSDNWKKESIELTNQSIMLLAGAEVSQESNYPGWNPNPQSKLLKTAISAYEELYNITPKIKAIHAGLECGLFLEKYPDLDMISFGPTLQGVHSPDERMKISSVEKFWNHLVLILRKIGEV